MGKSSTNRGSSIPRFDYQRVKLEPQNVSLPILEGNNFEPESTEDARYDSHGPFKPHCLYHFTKELILIYHR